MIDVDLVYLWVNGNDPKWIAKRQAFLADYTENEESCKGRYFDNEELKYSLRSVEKYAPWIRRIFIVTDNQVPVWLDTSHPKVQIVDHTEIMPPECLPCYNSVIIEHHLHKIPGLSEHFLSEGVRCGSCRGLCTEVSCCERGLSRASCRE